MYSSERVVCVTDQVQYDYLHPVEIVAIIITSIGIFLMLCIGCVAIPQLNGLTKLPLSLKYLFFASLFICIIQMLASLTTVFMCYISDQIAMITMSISMYCYFTLLLSLLATLLIRLHYTFNESIYKLTNKQKNIFIFLCVSVTFISYTAVGLYISIMTIHDENLIDKRMKIVMLFAGLTAIIYSITALMAVMRFTKNLLKLIKLQFTTSSPRLMTDYTEHTENVNIKYKMNIQFNEFQIKIINRVSRYLGLFGFAGFTSITTSFIIGIGQIMPNLLGGRFVTIILFITAIDCSINVIALYLQYSVADSFYKKWCKCIQNICKGHLTNKTIKSINKENSKKSVKSIDDAIDDIDNTTMNV